MAITFPDTYVTERRIRTRSERLVNKMADGGDALCLQVIGSHCPHRHLFAFHFTFTCRSKANRAD
ncbi:hypothetical protein J6590_017438 [Homalodisca vitripennis]|nr:hypothetical protein J6590_017438 [Homalodisca vitripennis]